MEPSGTASPARNPAPVDTTSQEGALLSGHTHHLPCLLEKWVQSSVGLLKHEVASALAASSLQLEPAAAAGQQHQKCVARRPRALQHLWAFLD